MKARYSQHILAFKRPSGTSRGIMTEKETWYLILEDDHRNGIGECGLLRGLSSDDVPNYEDRLQWVCRHIDLGPERLVRELESFPSIRFGVEQAFRSLGSVNPYELFPSKFTRDGDSIPINGLVWMGDSDFMATQIQEKLDAGFRCIKMKIGAIDFETELGILNDIRTKYPVDDIEIRVDANGAFPWKDALVKLERLASYDIHSIEQPIAVGNRREMAALCEASPIPIALDEELIGIFRQEDKLELLETIRPQYIILKPSLLGGYQACEEWIDLANTQGTGWWITSALESNVGLNAIAQWTYLLHNDMPQGLGTGSLYTNNWQSPLQVREGALYYDKEITWETEIMGQLCT